MTKEEKMLHIKLAYGYYQNKEYKKAIALYEKLNASDSDDANIMNMLGDTYFKGGNADKALEAYIGTMIILEKKEQSDKLIRLAKKVSKYFPDEQRVKTKIKSAVRLMMRDAERKTLSHDYAAARELYESLKEFNSDEFPVNVKIKEMNDEEIEYNERERKLKEAGKMRPADNQGGIVEKFEKMANNYITNGDYDGAVETYITALKLAPNNQELRQKLHNVYTMIAQKSSVDRVWDRIDNSPKDRVEEAKRKAMEDRMARIMKEEEERARMIMEEEEKIQKEYEELEAEIIKKAAVELKEKLEQAQESEQLKEEEIQRIMKEQEAKKRETLERLKQEAVEKFKKQKEAIQNAVLKKKEEAAAAAPQTQHTQETGQELPAAAGPLNEDAKSRMLANLRKAYEVPKINEAVPGTPVPELKTEAAKVREKREAQVSAPQAAHRAEPELNDDIGEGENLSSEIIVNEDTLDSLITTAFIYVNQSEMKEAMRIYNKLALKYPENQEVKKLLEEIKNKS